MTSIYLCILYFQFFEHFGIFVAIIMGFHPKIMNFQTFGNLAHPRGRIEKKGKLPQSEELWGRKLETKSRLELHTILRVRDKS